MNNPLSQATGEYSNVIPPVLPHEKVYHIQVGNQLFKLSGASLSSDSPSYFTEYFKKPDNESKVLFIDRDPKVFESIAAHLQGYYLMIPDDDALHTNVALDSFYFGLRRLCAVLTKEYYFIRVGNTPFKVAKSLIASPGNTPNYMTINNPVDLTDLAAIEVFNFLRPPPTKTVEAANRSPQLFADLLELLRGNTTVIKNQQHRSLLIKECKYFRFLELEQRIVNVTIAQNPYNMQNEDIFININDVVPKGLSVPPALPKQEVVVQYQRPYLLKEPKRDIVFQINRCRHNQQPFDASLHLNKNYKFATLETSGALATKLRKVFKDVIGPDEWLTGGSTQDVPISTFIVTLVDCFSVINGLEMKPTWTLDFLGVTPSDMVRTFNQVDVVDGKVVVSENDQHADKKRKLVDEIAGDIFEFRLLKSLWKLSLINGHPKLICISFEAVTDNASFNKHGVKFLN